MLSVLLNKTFSSFLPSSHLQTDDPEERVKENLAVIVGLRLLGDGGRTECVLLPVHANVLEKRFHLTQGLIPRPGRVKAKYL